MIDWLEEPAKFICQTRIPSHVILGSKFVARARKYSRLKGEVSTSMWMSIEVVDQDGIRTVDAIGRAMAAAETKVMAVDGAKTMAVDGAKGKIGWIQIYGTSG
jgi:hypothetical protein